MKSFFERNQIASLIVATTLASLLLRGFGFDPKRLLARLGVLALALLLFHPGNARADEAFQRALQLNPDLSVAHNLYTNFEVESLGRAKEAMVRLLTRTQSHSDPEIFTGLVIACRFCGLLDA